MTPSWSLVMPVYIFGPVSYGFSVSSGSRKLQFDTSNRSAASSTNAYCALSYRKNLPKIVHVQFWSFMILSTISSVMGTNPGISSLTPTGSRSCVIKGI
ncbi:hypothetical protein BGZ63DRAFT_392862 [Mariannaea sp. PMI_226]|nr:hypothetical protein BGZ63DRAFT_392862 [Mariannaea sp. PMI_226]